MILLPFIESTQKLEENRNDGDEQVIFESEQQFMLDHSDGIRLDDSQYIIDPDYQELMQIEDFEDLIVTKKINSNRGQR